jgi:hypothetical protein
MKRSWRHDASLPKAQYLAEASHANRMICIYKNGEMPRVWIVGAFVFQPELP